METEEKILYMQRNLLTNGLQVTVHQLGDGKEYSAVVKGIAVKEINPIYIVEMKYDGLDYDCMTVPASCIKEALPI